MNNDLISIIVPIYNVEQYIDRCLYSITNQTYQNIEIILVNDGSTDNSALKCDIWKKKDKRVKVIHKSNGGLSDARNEGFKYAIGEYVCFIDSDDWISLRFIEILYLIINKTNSDIVECDVKKTSEYVIEQENMNMDEIKTKIFTEKDCFYEFIKSNYFNQTVWNKMYKKELINNIPFRTGKLHEDEYWTYLVFSKSHRVTRCNYQGYYYFQRNDSIMGKKFSEKRMDGIKAKVERVEFVEKEYPEIKQIEYINFLLSCIYYCSLIYNNDIKNKNKHVNYLINQYKRILKKTDFKKVNFKKKLLFYCFYISPKMCCTFNKKYHYI